MICSYSLDSLRLYALPPLGAQMHTMGKELIVMITRRYGKGMGFVL